MNESLENFLFVDKVSPKGRSKKSKLDFSHETYISVEIERLLQFFSLTIPKSPKERKNMVGILSRALESLSLGDMSYVFQEKDFLISVDSFVSYGWGEIFRDSSSFRKTDKLLVFVQSPVDEYIYLYFQKQWNTYWRLKEQVHKRERYLRESPKIVNELIDMSNLNKEQQEAVRGAWNHPFSFILGGPGTGKTTVIASLVAGILARESSVRVSLLAPTGRATARLRESLSLEWSTSHNDPALHRLDGDLSPQTIQSFLYHEKSFFSSLPYEDFSIYPKIHTVIVDEISMVSPSLFEELLSFLSPTTRLILVGDPHQLPSVAEGFLLGYFPPNVSGGFYQIFSLSQSMRTNNPEIKGVLDFFQSRFQPIEKSTVTPHFLNLSFVEYWNLNLFLENIGQKEKKSGVFFIELPSEDGETMRKILRVYMEKYHVNEKSRKDFKENPQEIFQAFFQSVLLTPLHYGTMGTKAMNNFCLEEMNKLEAEFFPMMVEKNQAELSLSNGDLGILWQDYAHEQLVFPKGESFISYDKERVQNVHFCFSMTVHKSQGSEFQEIFLFLPSYALEQILSQEIFYTAISRAKKRVFIFSSPEVLERIFQHKPYRENGLPIFP